MNAAGYLFLALVIIWALAQFQRDIHAGMATFLGCAVFMPSMLEIALPTGLPQPTIHRILLLIALLFLGKNGYFSGRNAPVPYLKWFVLLGFSQVVSFLCGVAFLPGLKGCTDYAIEALLFFTLVTVYLQKDGSAVGLLSSICYGLAAAGVLGFVEKYFGVVIPYAVSDTISQWMDRSDIASTYPHRILFGYAMAMGVPLAIGLAASHTEWAKRCRMHVITLVLIAGDYFSGSRGPWMGLCIGLAAMAALGGNAIRKKLVFVAVLTAAVLVLRPGVRDTITNLASSTFEQDSLKGASYQVRWQLWNVAWTEVRRSPVRFLFGYGPVSTEGMDFTDFWEGQEGATSSMEKIGYTSWDNNYAADLFELGVIGFALELILLTLISAALFRNWRQADPDTRVMRAGIASACFIFLFAMSNVYIFSPQLKYLFWALVAIGSNLQWVPETQSPELGAALAESAAETPAHKAVLL